MCVSECHINTAAVSWRGAADPRYTPTDSFQALFTDTSCRVIGRGSGAGGAPEDSHLSTLKFYF